MGPLSQPSIDGPCATCDREVGRMGDLKVGLVLPLYEDFDTGRVHRWEELRAMARLAESIGFDTVWVPDELLWRTPEWSGPRGWWECVAMTGAVAEATARVEVGTWVMSANQRNPGITVRAVETLDEISNGRFVFGLGAGGGDDEAESFGFPTDHVVSRFEDAIEIIVPMLRTGRADHDGPYHQAKDLESRPRGPRPGAIPLMLGASKPRTMALTARHADIWSYFARERSEPAEFAPLIATLERACEAIGRDPSKIGRSAGIFVEPTDATGVEAMDFGVPVRGSADQVADALRAFTEVGVTQVECMLWPTTMGALEAMGPVMERLHGA
jgi:alkanesulfonate monooxygenase SsuD/methylene tetrahydromethanopterin reductase-like flavin-dependent oxidoreductase (luciferase family)